SQLAVLVVPPSDKLRVLVDGDPGDVVAEIRTPAEDERRMYHLMRPRTRSSASSSAWSLFSKGLRLGRRRGTVGTMNRAPLGASTMKSSQPRSPSNRYPGSARAIPCEA